MTIRPSAQQRAGVLLFVYGTLRRGSAHPNASRLAAEADWLGIAHVAGTLWRVAHYPALSTGHDRIVGDTYRLRDPGSLDWLDAYEGCGRDDPLPQPYARAEIALDDGRVAQTYLWAGDTAALTPVAGGDWLAQ